MDPIPDSKIIGLTAREREILDHLAKAASLFKNMYQYHPDDLSEFNSGIHSAQTIISFRVASRINPSDWNAKIA